MQLIHEVTALRAAIAQRRAQGQRIALVPTMGNLHAGHASLVAQARDSADCVVVSIFVNPLQFDDQRDLKRYPRDLEGDARLLEEIATLRVGDPMDPEIEIGTLIDQQAAIRVEGMLDRALSSGAELLTGGARMGAQIQPAVLHKVSKEMELSVIG